GDGRQLRAGGAPRHGSGVCHPTRRWRITGQASKEVVHRARYTLEAIILVLVILWLLGWLVFPTAGNLVHLLLVLILVVVVIRPLQGRRPLPCPPRPPGRGLPLRGSPSGADYGGEPGEPRLVTAGRAREPWCCSTSA